MQYNHIENPYLLAKEKYSERSVDTELAVKTLDAIPLALHCWQGDDLGGFERSDAKLYGGGIQATGNYPGKARNLAELRTDIEKALSFIPGRMRLSIHASYGEFKGVMINRDEIDESFFEGWIGWAHKLGICLDFNATLFSHPLSEDGYTLSHRNSTIRKYWIEHVRRTRRIAAVMGRAQGSPAMNNIWIPDGAKDCPVDRHGFRDRLIDSLDTIFSDVLSPNEVEDSVEGKLFGIGSESFVVGSNDFYLGYAATRHKYLTLDMGHFHPTESVTDKISSILPFVPGILMHISRGVRWDSDHVVILNDDVCELMHEIIHLGDWSRIKFGLDYFDASINRIGAWVIGARSVKKAMLIALLEPYSEILSSDIAFDGFGKLALLEAEKTLPWSAVWDEYCFRSNVPNDYQLIDAIKDYEVKVLSARG